jgi:hypothetical protein
MIAAKIISATNANTAYPHRTTNVRSKTLDREGDLREIRLDRTTWLPLANAPSRPVAKRNNGR